MSIHQPTGEKPEPSGRDSSNRSPNPFAVPGALESTASHHTSPPASPSEVSPSSAPDWERIVDQFPFGLIVLGPGQELEHENAVCEQMLGASVKTVGGMEAWLALLCPDEEHRARVIESFREHVWRNQLTRTFSLRSLNGRLREIEFRSSLNRDGGITIVLQDLTETLRAHEAQRHGKLKFRALFSTTQNGVVLADRTGRILDANPAFLKFVDLPLRDIRRSAFTEFLHPEDAELLDTAEKEYLETDATKEPESVRMRIRTRSSEKSVPLSFRPVGEVHSDPSMWLYLLETQSHENESLLTERLHVVARKAKALFDAVPDLVFLIDPNLTVVDFAPPPQPWDELEMLDSWRGKRVSAIWPALGDLLSSERRRQLEEGKIVRAVLRGQGEDSVKFSVTLSPAGDGQLLAVVRNDSEKSPVDVGKSRLESVFEWMESPAVIADGNGTILEANLSIRNLVHDPGDQLVGKPLTKLLDESACLLVAQHLPSRESGGNSSPFAVKVKRFGAHPVEKLLELRALSESAEPLSFLLALSDHSTPQEGLPAETAQHQFRNQLQMVTSLFSVESDETGPDESLLKWQLRIRSLACAIANGFPLTTSSLLRQVTEEAARLLQLGPVERFFSLEAEEDPALDTANATPMALLAGELIRLVFAHRKHGSLPRLQFATEKGENEGLTLELVASNLATTQFHEEEGETVRLLVAQMSGKMSHTTTDSQWHWTLQFPHW
ncbi:MAG: PAS domain-containing protein [Verrucomicrobiota bacterium]